MPFSITHTESVHYLSYQKFHKIPKFHRNPQILQNSQKNYIKQRNSDFTRSHKSPKTSNLTQDPQKSENLKILKIRDLGFSRNLRKTVDTSQISSRPQNHQFRQKLSKFHKIFSKSQNHQNGNFDKTMISTRRNCLGASKNH